MRAVLLVLLLLAPSLPAAAAEDGPHLLVVVRSAGDAWSATLNVTSAPTGRLVHESRIRVPAGGEARVEVPLPPGEYALLLQNDGFGISDAFDTRGCPGAHQMTFVTDGAVILDAPDESGCLVAPPQALALVEEARAAYAHANRARPGVVVPMPGLGDAGTLREWSRTAAPLWDEAENVTFAWTPNATFTDEWGRETPGAEVDYDGAASECFASANAGSTQLRSESAARPHAFVRFDAGTLRVLAHARVTCESGLGVEVPGVWAPTRTFTALDHRDAPGFACVLRHGAQGLAVAERAPSPPLCDGTGEWATGEVATWRGLRALPAYFLEETPAGTRVKRAWLAEGVAYPLDLESWDMPAGLPLRHHAARLDAVTPVGAPLVPSTPLPPPDDAGLAPLDRLRGPAGGASMPFALRDASDAARADPRLADLQALLRRPDAALVGASYAARQERGSPAVTDDWVLLFSANGQAPVRVECQRARVAPLALAAPVARCDAPGPFTTAFRLTPRAFPPPPAEAPSWDAALARWGGDAPTKALYRAWTDAGDPPLLEVGRGVPSGNAPALRAPAPDVHLVRLDLATGATRSELLGTVHAGRIVVESGIVPLSVETAPAPTGPTRGEERIRVGATVAAVGLLALLAFAAAFALYTRLTRAHVLTAPARAAILDVVQAEPGIHASAVLERVGKAHGVGEYHLGVLVREGFLTTVETPGFRRYFPTGRFSHAEMRALAALRDGQGEKLYRLIEANPGIHLSDLAARAGLTLPYVSRQVKGLVDAGLVDKVQVGRAVALHALER